jgi:hypothetical protein
MLEKQPIRFELEQEELAHRTFRRGDIEVSIGFVLNEAGYFQLHAIRINKGDHHVELPWSNGLGCLSPFQIKKQICFYIDEPIVNPTITNL